MINPIDGHAQTQHVAPAAAVKPKAAPADAKAANPKPAPQVKDTVEVSATGKAAQAAAAILQEAMETPAQTAKEALKGDHQAMRLQAKEQAAEKAKKI